MSFRKSLLLGLLIVSFLPLNAQNSINTYDFSALPQSLCNNPAYDMPRDFYVSFPLTHLSVDAGSSGVTLWDVFQDNNIPIDTKLKEAVYQMTSKDAFLMNQKNELFNVGYRIHNGVFLSFGFYEELDLYANFPKSIAQLYYEGTTYLDRRYTLNPFAFQMDLVGVYHIGIQKKLDDKIQIGGRFKLYSGVFNLKSSHNTGSFVTGEGRSNTYYQAIQSLDARLQTSGVVYENYDIIDKKDIVNKLLFKGNKGIGIDLGFTYHYDENLSISGSINDLGIIFNSKDVTTYQVQGSYLTEGINLNFDPDHPMDYWQSLEDDFNENIHYSTDDTSYISWRPLKLNAFIQYGFGRKRYASCTYDAQRQFDFKTNAVGALLQLQKRPQMVLPAISVFYEKNFNNVLQTRLSYTADKFSQTNIGVALSFQLWKLNFFAGMNHLLAFSNLAKAHTASLQFGLTINSMQSGK